jgi:hypothetical protein
MVAQLCALAAWWESYPLLWRYLWLSPLSSLLTIRYPQDLLKHTSLWLRRITEHQTHKPHYPSLSWMHEIDTYIAKQLAWDSKSECKSNKCKVQEYTHEKHVSLEESKVSIYLGLEIHFASMHTSPIQRDNACQQWHNSKETQRETDKS